MNGKDSQAKKPPPPPDKEFEGSVKSWSAKHGHGYVFMFCEEAHRICGKDGYLPKDVVPDGTTVLDRLSFTLTLGDKGDPHAAMVSRTPKI